MNQAASALLSGTIFGAGLATAQMTNPAKVLGFLDITGAWDPSLAFVMGAAVGVSAVAYRMRGRPAAASGGIDFRLIGGAMIFGLGWGLAGFCPGPAVAALATGSGKVLVFAGAMLAGMAAFRLVERGLGPPDAVPPRLQGRER